MDDKITKIANEIVDRISLLSKDSEFVMGDYFKDFNLSTKEKFKLMNVVLDLCGSKNIEIENIQSDMCLGMPWVFTYKKNN